MQQSKDTRLKTRDLRLEITNIFISCHLDFGFFLNSGMQVRCGGLEGGITHPKATAPAMASPKAADFPRPLAAVNATVLLRVFSEMASMNFRTAFAWGLENPQKTALEFLSHCELPRPENLSFGQHTNLIQGFAAIHQHSHRLCVLQALLQLPQLQVLGLQALLLRAHNRMSQGHYSTFLPLWCLLTPLVRQKKGSGRKSYHKKNVFPKSISIYMDRHVFNT